MVQIHCSPNKDAAYGKISFYLWWWYWNERWLNQTTKNWWIFYSYCIWKLSNVGSNINISDVFWFIEILLCNFNTLHQQWLESLRYSRKITKPTPRSLNFEETFSSDAQNKIELDAWYCMQLHEVMTYNTITSSTMFAE